MHQFTSLQHEQRLYELVRVGVARASRGASHLVRHCEHPMDERERCDSCTARWHAVLAADALERAREEVWVAADRVLLSTLGQLRAAQRRGGGCVECSDLALDLSDLRRALSAVIVGRLSRSSELDDEVGERHVQGPGDTPEGQH